MTEKVQNPRRKHMKKMLHLASMTGHVIEAFAREPQGTYWDGYKAALSLVRHLLETGLDPSRPHPLVQKADDYKKAHKVLESA